MSGESALTSTEQRNSLQGSYENNAENQSPEFGFHDTEYHSVHGTIGISTHESRVEQKETTNAVERSKPTAIFNYFVGGIHPEAWDDDLRNHFSLFGRVKEVQVMKDHATGRNRGFGFVTLEVESSKTEVFPADYDHIIKGKKVDVRDMQPEGHSNLHRKIFVGGINPALGEDTLEKYFGQYGAIEKVTIMRDMEGRSRGFGFVVYEDEATCQAVLLQRQHNVTNTDKVEVRRAEARSRTWRGRGPYGYRGMGRAGFYDSSRMGYGMYDYDPYVGSYYDWSYDPNYAFYASGARGAGYGAYYTEAGYGSQYGRGGYSTTGYSGYSGYPQGTEAPRGRAGFRSTPY